MWQGGSIAFNTNYVLEYLLKKILNDFVDKNDEFCDMSQYEYNC